MTYANRLFHSGANRTFQQDNSTMDLKKKKKKKKNPNQGNLYMTAKAVTYVQGI